MREGIRLGLDVGSVRIGVAASDPEGILATPVRTVTRVGGTEIDPLDEDLAQILTLIRELPVLEVVVGWPLGLNGAQGASAHFARSYAQAIAGAAPTVSVRLLDERFTSVDAQRALRESGVRARDQRGVVDQAAAVLILQSALDSERRSGQTPGRDLRARKPRTPRTKGNDR